MLFDGAPTREEGAIEPDMSRPGLGLVFKRRTRSAYAVMNGDRAHLPARRRHVNDRPTGEIFLALALLGASAAVGAVAAARRPQVLRRVSPSRCPGPESPLALPAAPVVDARGAVRAARRLNRAAGTIAASVLIDSAMEHYRGAFVNKAMYTPLVVVRAHHPRLASTATGIARRARTGRATRSMRWRALTGVVGTAFHLYNVGKRPGGFCWQNLFYAAPLGAPAAISLAGMTGYLAERVRDNPRRNRAQRCWGCRRDESCRR